MARKRRKITPEERRQTRLDGLKLDTAPWEAKNIDALMEDRYDGEAWIDPAKWDACVDDGARVLRCGHCGESTAFNVRDHLDVLCEGCGTTYMARPVE